MKKIRTILIGLGNVNLGLLNMLSARRSSILERYDLAFTIVGVADSTGFAARAAGFSYEQLIELKAAKKRVRDLKEYVASNVEDIANCVPADLLIEGSAGNLQTGNPALAIVMR
jgi:homoserine dehydrogenase